MSSVHSVSPTYRRFFRGRQDDAAWVRPALLTLLVLTGIAYIWGLDQSGWSNSFYSAAVQAASKSWKAFFFGSLDASNFITVDKPPASLWVMDLSVRIFGLNSWSILVPEALEGVACVGILYCTIRRWFSAGAALLAGTALAITPVAALMFRFNNPDALLVLLLTASAYALTRALEEGKTKWLIWAAVLIGLGFLTKMLAAFLIIPAFLLVYVLFAPVSWRKRIVQIILSAVTVIVSAGWWVAIVQLIPASDRPYIGSSQNNSILNLIFGYNGLGRLSGDESGLNGGSATKIAGDAAGFGGTTHAFAGGGGMGAGFSGTTGPFRLFAADMGSQISWLIPAALILFIVTLWLIRRNWRTDKAVQGMLLWFVTFLVTGLAFSLGQGIIHTYYTVALAPAIAAIVGIGVDVLWRKKDEIIARLGLAGATLATAVWAFVLLNRSPSWYPWLRFCILILGGIATIGIIIGPKLGKRLFWIFFVAAGLSGLAGPLAYTLDTVSTPHTGSTPTAGPSVSSMAFGGRSGGGFGGGTTGSSLQEGGFGEGSFNGQLPNEAAGNGSSNPSDSMGKTGTPRVGSGSSQGAPGGSQVPSFPSDTPGDTSKGGISSNLGNGGLGTAGDGSTPSTALVKLLQTNASKYSWVLATTSSMSSASYQLASGEPVMAMGGFSGSDKAITLVQFKQYVSEGKIHYYLAQETSDRRGISSGNSGEKAFENGTNTTMPNLSESDSKSNKIARNTTFGKSSSFSAITNWVENNFRKITVGGVTLYDLSQPKS